MKRKFKDNIALALLPIIFDSLEEYQTVHARLTQQSKAFSYKTILAPHEANALFGMIISKAGVVPEQIELCAELLLRKSQQTGLHWSDLF